MPPYISKLLTKIILPNTKQTVIFSYVRNVFGVFLGASQSDHCFSGISMFHSEETTTKVL